MAALSSVGGLEKMNAQGARVLVVGPEQNRAQELAAAVGGGVFRFSHITAAQATRVTAATDIDLILLDCPLLDEECIHTCRALRTLSSLPIIVCSFSSMEADIVRAYEAGADDYLVLPMRPVELNARLRAALRRAGERENSSSNHNVIAVGDLEIRLNEYRVFRAGREIDLSPIEFRLLAALTREAGRAVSHSRLLSTVWGPEYVDCRNYLRLYIRYLRNKIEDDPAAPEMILNEWGVGYRFEVSVASRADSAQPDVAGNRQQVVEELGTRNQPGDQGSGF